MERFKHICTVPNRLAIWCACLMVIEVFWVDFAGAQEINRRFLMVSTTLSGAALTDEEMFLTTVKLNLGRDDMTIIQLDLQGFEEMPVQDKVDYLQPIIRQHNAQGAMWLSVGPGEMLTLYVTTIEVDRAMVLLFRRQRDNNALRELARTAAEHFESAYLLASKAAPIEKMGCPLPEVKSDTEKNLPLTRPVTPHWYISIGGMGALVGHIGPSVQVNGSTGVLLDIAPNLGLALGVGGGGGPFGASGVYSVDGWDIIGELVLSVHLVDTGFQLGPTVGISGGLQSIRAEERGVTNTFLYPKADATFGMNLSIPISSLRMNIKTGLFISPYRTQVTASVGGDILYRNQALGWFVSNEWIFF